MHGASPAKSVAGSPLEVLDRAPLTPRYWGMFAVTGVTAVIEFVDLFIVGFLISAVTPLWGLTFSQVAIILLAAGVGSVIGGAVGGGLADRFGRKNCILAACLLTALVAGGVGLLPDGAWVAFAALRFFVGIGQGFIASATLPFLVEWTPVRHRTVLTSIGSVFPTLGIVAASALAAALLDSVGWRGVALLGFMPVISAVLVGLFTEESPRWLLSRGRVTEAKACVRKVFGVEFEAEATGLSTAPAPRFRDLFAHPRQVLLIVISWLCFSTIQYGVLTWGPMLLAQSLGVSPGQAAAMFVVVSIAGVVGVISCSFLAASIGRSATCRYALFGASAFVLGAAYAGDHHLLGAPTFLICLAVAEAFLCGVVANLNPYSAELWPARLAGRGVGLGQVAGGVGKIAGPAALAIIAGSGDLVTPKATIDAIVPSFTFLAGLAAMAALAFTVVRIETHRRTIALSEA